MNLVKLKDFELLKVIPQSVLDHPGMISRQERHLLYTLTRRDYHGAGLVIDAGVFLGASTVALSQGLADNDFPATIPKPIQSFEMAVVRANFERHARKNHLPRPQVGESFEQILRTQIAHTATYVDLHIGDILDFDASSLNKVEIAFLDILKNKKICEYCFYSFVPKIIEGGYLIQQDYFFDDLPFIKYMTEMLDDHLIYRGEVRSSALFQIKRTIAESTIRDRVRKLSVDDKLRLHAQAEGRTASRNRQYIMQLSRARLLVGLGRIAEATAVWEKADDDFKDEVFDVNGRVSSKFLWRQERLEELLNKPERDE